jgi:hypothetical protein
MTIQEVKVAPRFERVMLTPDMARRFLENNKGNRNVRRPHVHMLAQAIKRGEWKFNGQPIIISVDNRIMDGQHRNLACIEANMPIDTIVFYGADASAMDTIDMGVARNVRDVLHFHGYKSTNDLAAFGSRCLAYRKAGLAAASDRVHDARKVTPGELLEWAEANSDTSEYYLTRANRVGRLLGVPISLVALLMVVTDEIDSNDSEFFWSQLLTGLVEGEWHPIRVLREYLLAIRGSKSRSIPNQKYTAAIFIKAWNKFRDGDEVRTLQYRPGGSKPEAFPEPK